MSKIYTKTGDKGKTGLFGGARISKGSERVESYGSVDELGALLGLIRSVTPDEKLREELQTIHLKLFQLNSELATPPETSPPGKKVEESDVQSLESMIDSCDSEIPPLDSFILPGGSLTSSYLHWARTVCRRAERAMVRLSQVESLRPALLSYINRLSDLLFSLARRANYREGIQEIKVRPQEI